MSTTTMAPKKLSERNPWLFTSFYRRVMSPLFIQEAAASLSFAIPRIQRFLAHSAESNPLWRSHLYTVDYPTGGVRSLAADQVVHIKASSVPFIRKFASKFTIG